MRQQFLIVAVATTVALGCGSDGGDEAASTETPERTATPTRTAESRSDATPMPQRTATAEPTVARDEEADPREAAQEYYFAMDDLGVRLDTAIGDALDGDPGALRRIEKLRKQIIRRNKKNAISGTGGIGGNALLSAATSARDAAIDENLPRLVQIRQDVADARETLVEDDHGF